MPLVADIGRSIDAVWRIEGARIVATLVRMTGDVGLAEDLAQEALADALVQWRESGVPHNAGAWLTTVSKRKAIDHWRRKERLDTRYQQIAHTLDDLVAPEWEPINDDVLRLVFIACHPVLTREAQVPLTLRVVGGLTTEEIARLLLLPMATVQQRIVRAKKTLAAANVPFETPEPAEWRSRLSAVLAVIYLIFTEGYVATSGPELLRVDLAEEALRLGRMLSALLPREPEVFGLLALMEFQAARFGARLDREGNAVPLEEQDRSAWDRSGILRGNRALDTVDALGKGRGPYALQASIAQCHALATSVANTDWERIVLLYEALGSVAPGPVVALNHAVAVSMATGPASALRMVDALAGSAAFERSALLPSVRGELLARLGRTEEARTEFGKAASLMSNERQRRILLSKLEALNKPQS